MVKKILRDLSVNLIDPEIAFKLILMNKVI